jgi:3-oxoadipate enol-lactonase / 4-carboxymuconolactone decarboxylase
LRNIPLPFVQTDGIRHFYHLDGCDDRSAIIFSHSLGLDHGQWERQAADLLPHFRVLRYDIRGHGASDAPNGDYALETLGRDVLAIADAAGVARFAFCGLSLGGMIGQWLGISAGERITHLVLANTTPQSTNPAMMEERRTKVLKDGMTAIVDSVMQRFFTRESLASNSADVVSTRRTFLATNPVGYAGCCAAIRDMDNRATLGKIQTPSLIVFGDHDISTPWTANGEILATSIPGAQVVGLPTAHLSNLEAPRAFSAALFNFLQRSGGDPPEEGFAKRREVLGHAHVDRAVANTTDFNREFQELITRYAWGTIWTRPQLDQRTRRMLVLTALAARGCWDEFRMHLRTGLAHELEPCDVKEVLLQLSIYAGIPAANTGFHIATEELQRPRDQNSE